MTPSVRMREYTPTLTQQQLQQLGHGAGAGNGTDATTLPPSKAVAAVAAASQQLTKKLGATNPFLQTHGDLWAVSDQDDKEDITLEVRAPSQASASDPPASGPANGTAAAAAAVAAAAPPAAPPPPQSALLVLPAWLRGRPFSTCLHLAGGADPILEPEAQGEPAPDLRTLPEPVREAALVDDLLFCFMGLPGRCLRPVVVDGSGSGGGGRRLVHGPALAFAPAAALDERSAELVRKLLPMAEYAAVIERFAVTRDRWVGGGGKG